MRQVSHHGLPMLQFSSRQRPEHRDRRKDWAGRGIGLKREPALGVVLLEAQQVDDAVGRGFPVIHT